LPVAMARPFNTYGPRQSARAVIPTIILQALNGSKLALGSLHPTRDLTYVEDTVSGLIAVAASPHAVGEVINLGSNGEISIGDLAQLILAVMEKEVGISREDRRVRPENSEVDRLMCDNAKAKELLDWEPGITLKEGLKRTIDWFSQHRNEYKDSYTV
jgi:nucleoside-diphosphate-sugar epimerase